MNQIKTELDQMGFHFLDKALKKAYEEALRNEDFRSFVVKTKIDPKILMKYTSLLEISQLEDHHCQNCKNILECRNKISGYAYLPVEQNDELIFSYRPCKYTIKETNKTAHLKNINMIGVHNYITDATLDNIYLDDKKRHEAILWIKKFLTNYPKNKNLQGLYLCGNFGCGKTYLISTLFNELALKGFHSSIVFWPDFLRDLKSSFDGEYKNKFEQVKCSPILLIDDIGAEVVTPFGRDEVLCSILQYRMQEHLPTFFTTNFTKEQLEQHLSVTSKEVDELKAKRIMERINQLTDYIEMVSNNLRK